MLVFSSGFQELAKAFKAVGDKSAIAEGLEPKEFWKAVAEAFAVSLDKQHRPLQCKCKRTLSNTCPVE